MKVTAQGQPQEFEPIILTITIENKQELADLYGYANKNKVSLRDSIDHRAMPDGYEYNGSFTFGIYKVLKNYLGRL